MSVKMALAKLSATAAGGAILAGGAVHVAEQPITDNPTYKSVKAPQSIKAQPRYIKEERPTTRRRATLRAAAARAAERTSCHGGHRRSCHWPVARPSA